MPSEGLKSLRQIARDLSIPESTARYYRDAFARFIPSEGAGRRRRYPQEACDILKLIADAFAAGRSRGDIERMLAGNDADSSQSYSLMIRNDGNTALYETLLASEREGREAMWQMAQEIVRLGEAVERQQETLAIIARHLAGAPVQQPSAVQDGGPSASELSEELEQLHSQLDGEKELVERLRRSRTDLEQRLSVAEQRLERESGSRSVIGRILGRE